MENTVMISLSELTALVEEGNNEEAVKLSRRVRFAIEERNRILSISN